MTTLFRFCYKTNQFCKLIKYLATVISEQIPKLMKKFYHSLLIISLLFIAISCNDDDEIEQGEIVANLDIANFVWKGLNLFYLWQDDIPDLSDQRFSSQEQLDDFLKGYDSPESLFDHLLYNEDKYSWMVDDYVALEKVLYEGITGSNGVDFGLALENSSSTAVFGFVQYIVPNSDASSKNIKRGDIFHAVNGTPLTVSNYYQLLFSSESYTLNLADYNNGNPTDNGISVNLTKSEIQENPVHTVSTIDDTGKKIGYLMYNRFNLEFHSELNNVFGNFEAAGITDLVLDLRYNPGGTTSTALYLAGMITGQFNGQLFSEEIWNSKWQNYFNEKSPESLINNFVDQMNSGESINSLNLDKIVILTTGGSASASELIINGLKPYINVTTIGTKTEGKYVGSVTLYDSENFGREGANPDHTYAMQPIVFEVVNKIGANDKDGFEPTISNPENFGNMGVLGDPTEPLLARAIQFITTGSKMRHGSKTIEHQHLTNTQKESLAGSNMYSVKNLPLLK